MKRLNLIILLFAILNSYSQDNFNSDNFIVTRNDLETNTYKKDSTANALVIREYGNSYFDKESFKLVFEYKQKLKILNKNGFDKATITVYLYNSDGRKEKIKDIIATTHNFKTGQDVKTKLDKSQIFTEKYNDNYDIVKFTMPNITEGSVIVYSYTLESPFIYKYKSWEFQDDIPKLYSEYNTSIPANYEYNIKLVGTLPLIKNETSRKNDCLKGGNSAVADCFVAIYAMEDIPAFIDEDYMTTRNNYLARIEYELKIFRGFDGSVQNITKTWETVDKELKTDQNIGKQLNKNVLSSTNLPDSIITNKNLYLRAKHIYKYVQSNFKWNEKYSIYNESSVKDLIKEKSGNVAEINILLHNLLRENNIDVDPILISTRNNGLATKVYPVISDFNYLIVQATINNKTYFLDATNPYLSFGELPFRCLNQYGRKLDFKNGSEWIDIKPGKTSIVSYKVQLEMDASEVISGTINSNTTGYHALPLKEVYFDNPNNYLTIVKDKHPDFEIQNYDVLTKDKTSFNFNETYEISYSPEKIGETIYLNPFILKFFTENPFKLQDRTYPIDFGYKDSYLYNFKIFINDDYEVLEVPKPANIKLPNNTGEMVFKVLHADNQVQIYFKIDFDKEIYEREFYDYLKKFMSQIVNTQKNSLIVLKKK